MNLKYLNILEAATILGAFLTGLAYPFYAPARIALPPATAIAFGTSWAAKKQLERELRNAEKTIAGYNGKILGSASDSQKITQLEQSSNIVSQQVASLKSNAEALEKKINLAKIEAQSNIRELDTLIKTSNRNPITGLEVTVAAQVNQILNNRLGLLTDFNQRPGYDYQLVLDRDGSRKILMEALDNAENRLILVCPWLSKWGADGVVISKCRELLRRGVSIDIGWGKLDEIENGSFQSNKYNNGQTSFINLSYEFPSRLRLKVIGTHEKYLVCDNKFAMLGSHNFLTSGSSSNEREIGIKTNDTNIIKDLIKRFDSAREIHS